VLIHPVFATLDGNEPRAECGTQAAVLGGASSGNDNAGVSPRQLQQRNGAQDTCVAPQRKGGVKRKPTCSQDRRRHQAHNREDGATEGAADMASGAVCSVQSQTHPDAELGGQTGGGADGTSASTALPRVVSKSAEGAETSLAPVIGLQTSETCARQHEVVHCGKTKPATATAPRKPRWKDIDPACANVSAALAIALALEKAPALPDASQDELALCDVAQGVSGKRARASHRSLVSSGTGVNGVAADTDAFAGTAAPPNTKRRRSTRGQGDLGCSQ
jgi:hypothetical protein